MNIGETIRKYRKEKNMTQEQMAERLGVTAPAVNKWEKGNSLPDIMLLSPVARLLGISLDVLLSYQEELSDHEADKIIEELNEIARQKGTEHAYKWFKGKLELYPNSTALCVKGTLVFDVARMIEKPSDTEKYDTFVITNYERGLLAKEQEIRELAADSLFSFYMRKEDYKKANAEFEKQMNAVAESYEKIADILTKKHYEDFMDQGFSEKESLSKARKKANEDARFILPNACETKIIVTMNIRSLLNFFKHRCCNRAQWEIRENV